MRIKNVSLLFRSLRSPHFSLIEVALFFEISQSFDSSSFRVDLSSYSFPHPTNNKVFMLKTKRTTATTENTNRQTTLSDYNPFNNKRWGIVIEEQRTDFGFFRLFRMTNIQNQLFKLSTINAFHFRIKFSFYDKLKKPQRFPRSSIVLLFNRRSVVRVCIESRLI